MPRNHSRPCKKNKMSILFKQKTIPTNQDFTMNPSISNWICTYSSKNLFVKIVHPGGRVELYDRPIAAAELLQRNPKCCVAHPTVFEQPHAIISPSTTLALGHKYYVVPISTIRRLQLKCYLPSQSQTQQPNDDHKQKGRRKDGDHKKMESAYCWLMRNNNKNGENDHIKSAGVGKVVAIASFDHWQPRLGSIIEE